MSEGCGWGPDVASHPVSLGATVLRGGAGVGRVESLETLGVAEFKEKLFNVALDFHDTRAGGREHQVRFPESPPRSCLHRTRWAREMQEVGQSSGGGRPQR